MGPRPLMCSWCANWLELTTHRGLDIVFSVCIVRLWVLVYGKCECFVMQMLYICVLHPVEVLNAAFCMTCSLLMLVEDARGDHMEEAYS